MHSMDDRKRERGRQGEKGVAMTSQPKSVNVAKCCGKLKGRERERERAKTACRPCGMQ